MNSSCLKQISRNKPLISNKQMSWRFYSPKQIWPLVARDNGQLYRYFLNSVVMTNNSSKNSQDPGANTLIFERSVLSMSLPKVGLGCFFGQDDSIFCLQNLQLHSDHHERLMELIQNMTPTSFGLVSTPPVVFWWLSGLYLLACGKHQEFWRMLQHIMIYIIMISSYIGQER